jgi:predicted nucleic acid-binding Zn ribbon protein
VHGEEHRFCQRCGQLLKGTQVASARPCTRCGSYIYPGQKFCTECGLPLRVARIVEEEDSGEPAPLFYPRSSDRRTEPVSRRRQKRSGRFLSLLIFAFIVIAGVYVYSKLPVRTSGPAAPVAVAPQDDLKREVEKISEKIRSAHLNKDINKWLSCYNSAYPNLGQLENRMLELWKNYDIKDVTYRIANVRRVDASHATADIVWNIQVYDHRTHDYTLVRQSYQITLENGSGGWKIRNSKEDAGGNS